MTIDAQLQAKITATNTVLKEIEADFSPAGFANSFGAEDMVLMDLICKQTPNIVIFTLDTGRLPAETYALMQQLRLHYDSRIKVYFPDAKDVEQYLVDNGPNAFYDSLELRKRCCAIRKIAPLQRALKNYKVWITGQRRDQALSRTELAISEWDEGNQLQKFNPLNDWSNDDVWAYLRHHEVPYNALHDQHFPSIGCAPCTRSVTMGEDIRSGRWWWENAEGKECGLHPIKRKG
ncbi:MAG: phosphoadenylyl-sulfate reductase [Gammaproteobacteria bacterium]|nr:phosphoadenylyl-sulfate reductase [Gammaproteobacteria bacterium]